MSIEDELETLKTEDGRLEPEPILKWALVNKDSDLHKAIDWDKDRCAWLHQIDQVRRLIKLHIVFKDRTPAVFSLPSDRIEGAGYRKIDDIIPHADLRQQMLQQCLADIERLQRRYSYIQELCDIWDAAQNVRQHNDARRKKRRG